MSITSISLHPQRSRLSFIFPVILLVATLAVNTACTSKSRRSSSRRISQGQSRPVNFTAIRDPLVRAEIHAELNSFKDYEQARRELLETYAKNPLPGPLTVAKLEADLAAKYKAKAKEKAFAELANGQSKIDSKAESIAGVKPSSIFAASLLSSKDKDQVASAPVTGVTASSSTTIKDSSASSPFPGMLTGGDAVSLAPANSVPTSRIGTRVASNEIPPGPMAGLPPGAAEPGLGLQADPIQQEEPRATLKKISALENSAVELSNAEETPLIFDYPVTYNASVRRWITFFQTSGRSTFKNWLERSSRYLPFIQYELAKAGLPQDLAYVAMIESGFSNTASSHASALGLWQFIAPTGNRYGLRTEWWLDERRDFLKSTRAAIRYMTDLYRQFNSWYLVAASYNMGEFGVERLIKRHRTNNFWDLADLGALPQETKHYVPKIIAAMLISKAPALYGFRELEYQLPFSYDYFHAPGGTDLVNLARYLGVSEKYLKDLNPELIKGFVPRNVASHRIRIPKGSEATVAQYVRLQASN